MVNFSEEEVDMQKKIKVSPDLTLADLKDIIVKNLKAHYSPKHMKLLKKRTGDDNWEELADGPLNLEEKNIIKVEKVKL